MVDAPSLKEWKIKYQEWTGIAVPLFKEGKAKGAAHLSANYLYLQ